MGSDEMRAADADRQAVADALRVALDEGRLDLHEYDERLQQAYAAKTYGELQPLLRDLPAASLPTPSVTARPAVSDAETALSGTQAEWTRRWVMEVWAGWFPVVGITTVIWAISCIGAGELNYFWPIWVAGPWGLVLVFATLGGLANGEPRKQAEKRARKERLKQAKRERKALEAEAIARGELPEKPAKDKKKSA